LTVVEDIPEYTTCDSGRFLGDADSERAAEAVWGAMGGGDPPGGWDFGMQAEPEAVGASDPATIVLSRREHGRFPGWLRTRRFAAATLLVLGAGASIRLLRRPIGRETVRQVSRIMGIPQV